MTDTETSDDAKPRGRGPSRTSREDWINIALDTLISDGVDSVKVLTLAEKLVFGRYCVDKTGDHLDVQEASLDWLITDARRLDLVEPSPEQKALAELLGSDLGNNLGEAS